MKSPGRKLSGSSRPARPVPPGLAQARAAYQQGRIADAARLCKTVLATAPKTVEALHMLGVIEAQQRNLPAAESLLTRAADMAPGDAGVWANLANVLRERGRHEAAVDRYNQALALAPGDPGLRINRGRSLKQLGRLNEALADYDAALILSPDHVDARFQRGLVLRALGRPAEALTEYDRVLEVQPGFAQALANRGNVLRELDHLDDAVASFDAALAADPDLLAAHIGRGAALEYMGRPEPALAAFRAALSLDPGNVEALVNMAIVLHGERRYDEALQRCDQALEARPAAVDAQRQRGHALGAMNRHEEAVACYDAVLAAQADDLTSLINRGACLRRMGRNRAALADYERVLALSAFHREALNNRGNLMRDLGRNREAAESFAQLRKHHPAALRAGGKQLNTRLMTCDWRDFEALSAATSADIRAGVAADTPFSFLAYSTSPEDQLACASAWIGEKHPPVSPAVWTGERYRHDRIRLAYLSADFQNHPMAYLMGKLFETHDRDRFELTAISFGRNTGDPMRKRLEAAFDRFIDVEARSDRETAELVRALEIDIAIDRKGFTRDARTQIFAMRPAPLQVNYLAYPGTMGAPYMDYLIADPVIIPDGEDRFYTEKVVRLPDTYQATDDQRPIGETPSRADCNLPETGFVFCSFNNNYKILPQMFDVWMRLLTRVEGSVLWLYVKSEEAIENLRREAAARGVDPGRLVFATHRGMAEHLARHRQADLFLDTFPYTAHTTASDALWAGLPVVTCAGQTFTSRVAASLLSAVGLPELITTDFAAYEALALKLALEPDRLAAVKTKLAEQRTVWPLFDSDRFRLHLESAFVTMHERQQRGLAPEAFAVPPRSATP